MDLDILTQIVAGAMVLLNSYLIWRLNRKGKSEDERDRAMQEMDIRLNAQEKACAVCRASLLTEEKMRALLEEQFRSFELRLINQGRLSPLSRAKGER